MTRTSPFVDTRTRRLVTFAFNGQEVSVGLRALTGEEVRSALAAAHDLVPDLKQLWAKWEWTENMAEKDVDKAALRVAQTIAVLVRGCVDPASPEDAPVPFFGKPLDALDLPDGTMGMLYNSLMEWQLACTFASLPDATRKPFRELNLT